jgi:hypothetical protein
MDVLGQIDFGKAALAEQVNEAVISKVLPTAISHLLSSSFYERDLCSFTAPHAVSLLST